MQLPTSFDALISKTEELHLYSKLVKQLNKDFLLANIDLDFDLNILPTSLKYVLKNTVFKLIQEKFAEYLNLLYIVDVSEKKVRQLDGNDTLKLSEQVTFLILQRTWQKVWYRSQYS